MHYADEWNSIPNWIYLVYVNCRYRTSYNASAFEVCTLENFIKIETIIMVHSLYAAHLLKSTIGDWFFFFLFRDSLSQLLSLWRVILWTYVPYLWFIYQTSTVWQLSSSNYRTVDLLLLFKRKFLELILNSNDVHLNGLAINFYFESVTAIGNSVSGFVSILSFGNEITVRVRQ